MARVNSRCRYFEGWTPVIAVSDPDILRDVLVKDFENFRSRKVRDGLI